MGLFELLFEKQIMERLKNLQRQINRYVQTVWLVFRSPLSAVRLSLNNRTTNEYKKQIAPIPFIILSLLLASVIKNLASPLFAVDKPFFEDAGYLIILRIYRHFITSVENIFHGMLNGDTVFFSLKFAIIILVAVLWARMLTDRTRRYWQDVASLSYLLPIALLADIALFCVINLMYRIVGENPILFAVVHNILIVLSVLFVYGILLRVVDQVYFSKGRKRVVHATCYAMVVPVLLFLLFATQIILPAAVYMYRVYKPIWEGDYKFDTGKHEAAENFYKQAIHNDALELFSGGARARLLSVYAQRILNGLPYSVTDSNISNRLFRHLVNTETYSRLKKIRQQEKPISPKELVELRDTIVDSYIATGDIPVTSSDVDCALRPTAAEEGCNWLPKESIEKFENTPFQREKLYYQIYRARALKLEPHWLNTMRYILFLYGLPARIEFLFVQYHAKNMMRDGKVLAEFDDKSRLMMFDRDRIVKINRWFKKQRAKYTHLKISDIDLEKLTDQEIGFLFCQAYLNYLRDEARLLAVSPVCREVTFIRQTVISMEEQLKRLAEDAMYRRLPPTNSNHIISNRN